MLKKSIKVTPKQSFAPTRPEDVFGSLHYSGPPKTIEQMDEGIIAETNMRHARRRDKRARRPLKHK